MKLAPFLLAALTILACSAPSPALADPFPGAHVVIHTAEGYVTAGIVVAQNEDGNMASVAFADPDPAHVSSRTSPMIVRSGVPDGMTLVVMLVAEAYSLDPEDVIAAIGPTLDTSDFWLSCDGRNVRQDAYQDGNSHFPGPWGDTCTPITECPSAPVGGGPGLDCGPIPDECGGTISCGSCSYPATCGGGTPMPWPNVCG